VEEVETRLPKMAFVVAIFLAKVDDCPDAVTPSEFRCQLARESAAHGERLCEPVEVQPRIGFRQLQSLSFT